MTLIAPAAFGRSVAQVTHGVVAGTTTGLLGCLAAAELALGLVMVRFPGELMYGEAILYAHARRLLAGAALYQPIDRLPYTVASYTPLFYAVAAGLQATLGPGFGPGRGLALICLGISSVLVGVLAASDGRGLRGGLLAALVFVTLGAPGSGPLPWTAIYKEDSLALALALGGMVLLSRASRSTGAVAAAGVLGAMAILTKQTYAPMVLAASGWLWWRNRRAAAVYLTGVLAPVVIVSGWLQLSTGAFLGNIVLANVNPIGWTWLTSNLQLLALFQLGPLLAAGVYCVDRERGESSTDRLLTWVWAGTAVQLVALAKVGGASNHWMSFAAVTAIFASRAVYAATASRRRAPGRTPWLAAAGLAIGIVLVAPLAAERWLETMSSSTAWEAANGDEFSGLVARVRAAPGEVIAQPLDVVALANRQPLFEPLLLSLFSDSGLWDTGPIVRQICDGTVSLVVLDRPVDSLVDWPRPIRAAIEASMHPQDTTAGRLIYVSNAGPKGPACSL